LVRIDCGPRIFGTFEPLDCTLFLKRTKMAPSDQFDSTGNARTGSRPGGQVSDKELMEKVKSEDTSAFSVLVDRYKVRLLNLIYRMLQDKEEAEDILQETFLRVYREKQSYDPTYAFSTWIYTITLNLCRNELKKRKRFKFFGLDLIKNNREYASEGVKNTDRLSSTMENAIGSLGVKYRTVFLLRDVNQLSFSRVNRARLMLRDRLKPRMKEYYELSKSSPLPIQLL
jgi:RNA polymerase sigma-70 factor (ECF subfamily)